MQKNYLTYGTAAKLSLGISVALFLFFIFSLYFREMFAEPTEIDIPTRLLVLMLLFGWLTIFLLLFFLFAINFRILLSDLSRKKKNIVVVLASVLFAVAFSAVISHLMFSLIEIDPPHFDPMPPPVKWMNLGRDLFLTIVVIFISQLLYLSQKRQQMELRYEALEAENIRTRYEALKNQVDPHFLFNTMSILDSLVDEDTQKTHEYIQKFSSAYRYILQNKEVVSLSEELDFIHDYIGLMQVRYSESLIVDFKTDPKFDHYLIVPLGLQTLVENAIKHNIISKQNPLTITIETTEDKLVVSNNYQPKDMPSGGAGIGLANLSERYALKWQKKIEIEQNKEMFRVTLPLASNKQVDK